MLDILIILLVLAWLLGLVGGIGTGGALHLFLVAALIVLVVRLAQGRQVDR